MADVVGERVHPREPRQIVARLERIDVWSLSWVFIGIIGLGFLFTFYDIFDINVSFVQTCVQIKAGCTPANAFNTLKVPVVLNLAGYVVGTLILSPIADRVGRRNMLLVTMVITGIGSLYNALAPGYANFVVARIITGVGVGADLALVNTYINEVAPCRQRGRYTAVIFTMSALGAFIGIWLGLILTTPATPWPTGLPFAIAGKGFPQGWRWMYGIGALLALVAVVLRVELPESPRWLIGQGRLEEADRVVRAMEERASRRHPLAEPVDDPSLAVTPSSRAPYGEVLRNPFYLRRAVLLLVVWFVAYITVYGYSAGFTSVLTGLHYPVPEAGLIAAMGTLGFIAQGIVTAAVVEHLDRRYWLPIGAVLTVVGAVLVAEGGHQLVVSFIGACLIFFGFNVWVSPTYALSAESFPTRARSTGFALVDGVGHIGGGIGVLAIASFVIGLPVIWALLFMGSFLFVSSVLVQFAARTRGRVLDEVSP